MSKQKPVPAPEPTITCRRSVKLTARNAVIKLSHLRELVRQANERGYDGDASVSVTDMHPGLYGGSRLTEISIGDDR